jgi:hypothetical protein
MEPGWKIKLTSALRAVDAESKSVPRAMLNFLSYSKTREQGSLPVQRIQIAAMNTIAYPEP